MHGCWSSNHNNQKTVTAIISRLDVLDKDSLSHNYPAIVVQYEPDLLLMESDAVDLVNIRMTRHTNIAVFFHLQLALGVLETGQFLTQFLVQVLMASDCYSSPASAVMSPSVFPVPPLPGIPVSFLLAELLVPQWMSSWTPLFLPLRVSAITLLSSQ